MNDWMREVSQKIYLIGVSCQTLDQKGNFLNWMVRNRNITNEVIQKVYELDSHIDGNPFSSKFGDFIDVEVDQIFSEDRINPL